MRKNGEVEDADPAENLKGFLKEKGMSEDDISSACNHAGFGKGMDEDVGYKKKSEEGEDEEPDPDADKTAAKKKMAGDDPPDFKGMPKKGGGTMSQDSVNAFVKKEIAKQKLATDAAIGAAVAKVKENAAAVRAAEKFVRPWVGDIEMAHDSARGVFKTALTALGVKTEGVHPDAYRSILEHLPKPGQEHRNPENDLANDEAPMAALSKRIPGIDRIKVMA